MISRWYTENQIFMQPSGTCFGKISASLSCFSSSIYLHVVATKPTLIPRWYWKICWLVPQLEFASVAFIPVFYSVRFCSRHLPFFGRISLYSDFASELLARAESCRRAHINANVIHWRGIWPDWKKFYKFWVGCNPSHGIARSSAICEDWSAPTFWDDS